MDLGKSLPRRRCRVLWMVIACGVFTIPRAMTRSELAIHTFTTKPWSIEECIENYCRHGFGGISIWRETVAGLDLQRIGKQLRDSGLKPISYVRGGFFTGQTSETRAAAIEDNRAVLHEAEMLGLPMVVLVCGATVGQSPRENLAQIENGIRSILPVAENCGIRLAIEPLHPMYAGDRCAVASMADANDLCEAIAHPLLGVAADVYHIWWDSRLEQQLERCASAGRLFAFHVCDFKPDFDHPLLDRELPGEGIGACAAVSKLVRAAGFSGLAEVEIFSRMYWSENQHHFLERIAKALEPI
jgi:sugar phosphate isomerase/epimerase